jgi:hypothetical protein
MFLLLAMAIIVTTITAVVLNNLKAVTVTTQALNSYYAAESGVERGLYLFQAALLAQTVGAQEVADILNSQTGQLTSQATYALDAQVTAPEVTTNIAEGDSVQFDLVEEDTSSGLLNIVPLADLHAVYLEWEPNCSGAETPSIEVSYTFWTRSQWDNASVTDPNHQTKYTYSCGSASCTNQLALIPDFMYKVRVKALQCSLDTLTVKALDSTYQIDQPLPLANTIVLASTGSFGITHQNVAASSVWRTPLLNYFDYVLFSEEAITK